MEGNVLDKILEDQGLNYEDLNSAERETYRKANFSLHKLTVADVKTYITNMKNSVALQLTETPLENTEENVILKARLKNYILLESFLLTPEKAEEALKKQLEKKRS